MVRFLCFSMEWFWNAWVCVAGLDTGQIFKSHSWDRDAINPSFRHRSTFSGWRYFWLFLIRWYIDFAKNIEISKLSRIFCKYVFCLALLALKSDNQKIAWHLHGISMKIPMSVTSSKWTGTWFIFESLLVDWQDLLAIGNVKRGEHHNMELHMHMAYLQRWHLRRLKSRVSSRRLAAIAARAWRPSDSWKKKS